MTARIEAALASLVERMELDFPVEELERLLFLLSRMTTALLERVRGKARAIAALRVVLRLDGGALPVWFSRTVAALTDLEWQLTRGWGPPVLEQLRREGNQKVFTLQWEDPEHRTTLEAGGGSEGIWSRLTAQVQIPGRI